MIYTVLNGKTKLAQPHRSYQQETEHKYDNVPSLWYFITYLQKEQSGRDYYYNQLTTGNIPKKLNIYLFILKIVEYDEQLEGNFVIFFRDNLKYFFTVT